jgi:hypothetical protein
MRDGATLSPHWTGNENDSGTISSLDSRMNAIPLKTVVLSGLCLVVAACGETKFLETMGMGKNVPDESQVRRNADLTLPPDLQLRQPSNAPDPSIPNTTVSSLPQPLPDASPAEVTASFDPAQAAAARPSAGGAAPVPLAGAQPVAAGNPRENAFVKYGISKTHPDGKPKTEQELNKELLAAIKAEKRRQDPKYGTIWNIGDLFGGD